MFRPALSVILSTAFSIGIGLASPNQSAAERGTELAERGECAAAMPLIHQALEQDTRFRTAT
jgi:hypothetical protein